MIPALERCSIVLSRLMGLAEFHGITDDIGFTTTKILRLMDLVHCLTLVSNNILLIVRDELKRFKAFSDWLRLEVEVLALPRPKPDDLSDEDHPVEHGMVLDYVEGSLTSSPLGVYFDKVSEKNWAKATTYLNTAKPTRSSSLVDLFDKELEKCNGGHKYIKALPNIDFLISYLTKRAGSVFEGIAEAEKRIVTLGKPTELDIGSPIAKYDVCTAPAPKEVSGHCLSISPHTLLC